METQPPVILGVTFLISFLIALALRRPLERFIVTAAPVDLQPKSQFYLDMLLSFAVGLVVAGYNTMFYSFPLLGSGAMVILGCMVVGFFISLDMALAREPEIIVEALEQEAIFRPPKRLYSMTRKFSLVAITTTLFVSVIFISVISRDIAWIATVEKSLNALSQARSSVMLEIFFIMAVLLSLVVNLIISYSRNLKLLFDNETGILERVSRGDLSKLVPVATNDEFGFIARHTNSMIHGLRHRIQLITSLKMAEEVQQNLLPRNPPSYLGIDAAGASIYCDETGGDYYDYLKLPHGRLGVIVADAADHGVGSALHMATARAFLVFGARDYSGPALLLGEINRYLTRDSSETGRFITLFFLEIDTDAKTLRWVRAGHDPAIFYNPGGDDFTELTGDGTALGVMEDLSFLEYTRQGWEPGSIVVVGTDGIRETRNKDNEMYGLERLQTVIRSYAAEPAEAIQNKIIASLHDFRGEARQEDDITLVVVKLL
ncbi:MAG: SpoIIE family protein phosphatase [Deltaproteobacteria bacterium]|nr:SpoIIE family protein phosphatase [Deltaproteobacteria bacterium]